MAPSHAGTRLPIANSYRLEALPSSPPRRKARNTYICEQSPFQTNDSPAKNGKNPTWTLPALLHYTHKLPTAA